MSVEGSTLLGQEGEEGDGEDADAARNSLLIGLHAVVEEKNKCGCTNKCTKIMAAVTAGVCVAFMGGGIGAGAQGNYQLSSFLWLIGLLALLTSCVGCNILCCACCQLPKDVEG